MTATAIDGKSLAAKVREEVATQVAERGHVGLATVLVGEDPASHVYINLKQKAASAAGFEARERVKLTFLPVFAQAAVEVRQQVAQLLEPRRLGLGGILRAEDDAQVVPESAVDGVLHGEVDHAGLHGGRRDAAGARIGRGGSQGAMGALAGAPRLDVFGERVYVRFDHRMEPFAVQWYRSIRLLFLSRFSV